MSIDRSLVRETLGELAHFDAPLGALTTYRVGGVAEVAVHPTGESDLRRVADLLQQVSVEVLVVGRGSNLLVSDAGFVGVAVFTDRLPTSVELSPSEDQQTVHASANTLLPVLARRTASAGLCGLEWAVGVPGSVGGAIRMNAGGHGSDIAASLKSSTICDLLRGTISVVSTDQLGLRFRGSALTATQLVLEAEFSVRPCDPVTANAQIEEIVKWRRDNQPGGQNAGSVFVNPRPGELSAGALIDDLGLRGMRHGTAEVSTKHANFIQADPDGSADDVVALMAKVREIVMRKSGIALRSEIRLVGFDPEMTLAAGGAV